MFDEIETYRDLRDSLRHLYDSQLDQVVQFMPPVCDDSIVVPLGPVIAIGTVEDLFASGIDVDVDREAPTYERQRTRSSVDNADHGDAIGVFKR